MPDIQELAATMKESIINPEVGDLFLDETGDAVALSSMVECTAQRLKVRFSFFSGEWFLDRNAGTPWFQHIFVKAPQDAIIRTILGQVIRECPGVSKVERLTYSISSKRVMTVNFTAVLVSGELLVSTNYPPFVITLDNLSFTPG